MASERVLKERASWNDAPFAHPYCLRILRRALDDESPTGATYTIDFTDSTYSFNPSPQNEERTNSVSGSYTYDPNTATVVLSATEDVTGQFNFATPTSGTVHWSETDGEMQDANVNQL